MPTMRRPLLLVAVAAAAVCLALLSAPAAVAASSLFANSAGLHSSAELSVGGISVHAELLSLRGALVAQAALITGLRSDVDLLKIKSNALQANLTAAQDVLVAHDLSIESLTTQQTNSAALIGGLQAADTAFDARIVKAETLVSNSSPLVSAVLNAAANVTALFSASAAQKADIAGLTTLTGSQGGLISGLTTLTGTQGGLITDLTTLTVTHTAQIAALVASNSSVSALAASVDQRLARAETLVASSSPLVNAVTAATTDVANLQTLTGTQGGLITGLTTLTGTHTTQLAALQSSNATAFARLLRAETLVPASSALVDAVITAGTDIGTQGGLIGGLTTLTGTQGGLITGLTTLTNTQGNTIAALQSANSSLEARVARAESLAPSSSALVIAVLNAGTNIGSLQTLTTNQGTSISTQATQIAALVASNSSLDARVYRAEALVPSSSALVTAVLTAGTNIGTLTTTTGTQTGQISDLTTLTGTQTTQIAALQASNSSLEARVARAEALVPSSSPLVSAVLTAGTNIGTLTTTTGTQTGQINGLTTLTGTQGITIAALQSANSSLEARVARAEALAPSSSPLVTAVLNAGTNIGSLQTLTTNQGTSISTAAIAIAALVVSNSSLDARVWRAESLVASSSPLVTAVLTAATNIGTQTGEINALQTLTGTHTTLISALQAANSSVSALAASVDQRLARAETLVASSSPLVNAVTAATTDVANLQTLTGTQGGLITGLTTLTGTHTTQLAALQSSNATAFARLLRAETLVPASSALVDAVITATSDIGTQSGLIGGLTTLTGTQGTQLTMHTNQIAALQSANSSLEARVARAEALAPSSSALVIAVLNAGTNIGSLQTLTTNQGTSISTQATAIAALQSANVSLDARVWRAENLVVSSSPLVTAVLASTAADTSLTTRINNAETLFPSSSALVNAVNAISSQTGSSTIVTSINALQNMPIVANGQATLLWSELPSNIIYEFAFSAGATLNKLIPGLPAGTRWLLADIFVIAPADDHFIQLWGPGSSTSIRTWVDVRNTQPSTSFTMAGMQRQHTPLVKHGQGEYFSNYGTWFPNALIPLNADMSFDWGSPGSGTSGYEYMVVKNVARESNMLLGNTLPLMVLQEFGTPLDAEWTYTGLTNRNIAIASVPAGARYLLADVFVTSKDPDAHILTFGRGNVASDQLYVLTPNDKPSATLTAPTKNQVQFVHYGELDGPSSFYGLWQSSILIPLNVDGSFDFSNSGCNPTNVGWIYMVVRAYSIPVVSVAQISSVHKPIVMVMLPQVKYTEIQWAGLQSLNTQIASVGNFPAGARYALCDVFATADVDDHQVFSMGRGLDNVIKYVSARGTQPTSVFGSAHRRHVVTLLFEGEADGWSSKYGQWYSNQYIPRNADGSIDIYNSGNSGSKGWLYWSIKGYSM